MSRVCDTCAHICVCVRVIFNMNTHTLFQAYREVGREAFSSQLSTVQCTPVMCQAFCRVCVFEEVL